MSNVETEHLHDLLLYTAQKRISIIAILFTIVLLLLLADVLVLLVGKKDGVHIWKILPMYRKSKPRLSIHDQIILEALALLLLLVYTRYSIWPLYLDLSNDRYVHTYGTYERIPSNGRSDNWLTEDVVYICVENDTIRLKLPTNWDSSCFPEGKFSGHICYSQNSKYLLIFDPVEQIS